MFTRATAHFRLGDAFGGVRSGRGGRQNVAPIGCAIATPFSIRTFLGATEPARPLRAPIVIPTPQTTWHSAAHHEEDEADFPVDGAVSHRVEVCELA